ncbi:NAD(P)-dependent oxidoreductase [Falsiroseomonas selenitidurans]|uniref:NAD(P)-dependent oxidoreductase n=1 Tax=Falsiroseomonas selenitidurans TaxID=2716335 RepID=A0ABX1E4R8_9PROT|nr:NAD(P)-dependent oxidoreductase [Falsiroseomonas selenitidurans]NKC32180.1 NAD(P)-dependent oxidoreductase [Falsiroseomonas selenitidurans]
MDGTIGRVGFIGIGRMGWPMAIRLVEAGYTVAVQDAVPGRAADFVRQHGGIAAASAAAAAQGADAVITMLPTSRDVAEVLAAIRPSLASGAVVIEMSSGEPSATRAMAAELLALGIAMVDAPVSGGVARAETGTLAIMTGGHATPLARVEPLLRAMGGSITRCGEVGAGQAMKALNNLVSAAGFLVSVEALLIGSRFGLDPAVMVDVLNASTGMNNSTQRKLKQFVLSGQFNSGFGLDLMVKDLTIALQVGRETATPAPLAAQTRELWAAAAGLLGPGQDHTAAAQFSEALAAHRLTSPQIERKE